MKGISEQERSAYEQIALAIFSRHSPQDAASQQRYACPKSGCDGQISEYDTVCSKCGSFYSACIASG